MSTCTRTAQSLSEALGSELITDGGFSAVTEGANLHPGTASDTADSKGAGWSYDAGNTEYDSNKTAGANSYLTWNGITVLGSTYKTTYTVKNWTENGVNDWVRLHMVGAGSVKSANGTYPIYLNALQAIFRLQSGGDAILSVDDLECLPITFTNWQGWGPQVAAEALVAKAYKAPSVSANLEQSGLNAEAGKAYRIVWTYDKLAGDAGDGITVEFGSSDGTLRTVDGTYTDNIIATDTDFLKFKQTDGNANLECTIAVVSAKEITRRGIPD